MPLTNKTLLGMIGGLSLLAAVLLSFSVRKGSAPDRTPFESVTLSGRASPMWSGNTVQVPQDPRPQAVEGVELYVDVSYPMGGFLPPRTAGDSVSTLRSVMQWTADHLGRTYGRETAPLKWQGVGEALGPLPASPRIDRGLFNGRASRIDLAVRDAISRLRSGRAEGAVLITDLMGTGETTGPLGVIREMKGWLESPDVRSGLFHVGLLGVKADYWGVTEARSCPEMNGLGCWFSERNPGYRRLQTVARMPFYVLVMGRGRDSVERIGKAIEENITEFGKTNSGGRETRWELLTAHSEQFDTSAICKAFRKADAAQVPQFALLRESDGTYRCVRREPVIVSCNLADVEPVSVSVTGSAGAASPFAAATKGRDVEVTVSCEQLISQSSFPPLILGLVANRTSENPSDWDGWNSETDEIAETLGRTPQLKYFLQEVRLKPENYRVALPPVLGASPK